MDSLRNKLREIVTVREQQEKEKIESKEQSKADARIADLSVHRQRLGEIITALKEIWQERLQQFTAMGKAKTSMKEYDQIFKEQLLDPEFEKVLSAAGISTLEDLAEPNTKNPQRDPELEAVLRATKDFVDYNQGRETYRGVRKTWKADLSRGLAVKQKARGLLKSTKHVEPGESESESTAELSEPQIEAGSKAEKHDPTKLHGTFPVLIKALEERLALYEKEYSELFPESTKGKEAEKLKQDLVLAGQAFFRNNQGGLGSRGYSVDALDSNLKRAAAKIGRAEANKIFSDAVGEQVYLQAQVEAANRESMTADPREVKKYYDYFSRDGDFEKQVNLVYKARNDCEQPRSRAQRLIEEIKQQADKSTESNDPLARRFGNHDNTNQPPFYSSYLNKIITSYAEDNGLIAYDELFGRGQQGDGALETLNTASSALNYSSGNYKPFPFNSEAEYGRGPDMVASEIPDPEQLLKQLHKWQVLFEAFEKLLTSDNPPAAVFSVGSDPKNSLKHNLPADFDDRPLDKRFFGYHRTKKIMLPRKVYSYFSGVGSIHRVSEIFRRIESKAKEDQAKILERLKFKLEAEWADSDLQGLQYGSETKDLLQDALLTEANRKVARDLDWRASDAMRPLVSQHSDEVTVSTSDPNLGTRQVYFESATQRRINEEAEEKIRGIQNKLNSKKIDGGKKGLEGEIDRLDKEITAFGQKSFKFIRGAGQNEKRVELLTEYKQDLQIWNKAESTIQNSKYNLERNKPLLDLMDYATKEGLRFSPEHRDRLNQSRTVKDFLSNLEEIWREMSAAKLPPEQQAVYDKYRKLVEAKAEAERKLKNSIQGNW